MASKSLKATQSASALKIAGSMTLKGADATRGAAVAKDVSTLKLASSGGHFAGDMTAVSNPSLGGTLKHPAEVDTVWEDEKQLTFQGKHLASLAGRVDRIGAAFHGETRLRDEQNALVNELHEDQMKRLDEIGFEINTSIAELTVYMDNFIQHSRGLLQGTFDGLHGDLRARIDGLLPRLRELESRGRAVSAGLEEERALRTQETTEVLVPLREQIEKLASDLQREQKVRETRNAEIQNKMDAAVASLDAALDTEIASREQRVTETAKELQHDQEQLLKRQDKVEQGLDTLRDGIFEETDLEKEQRIAAQDPIVEALASFIQKFQQNAHEQSHLGN